MHKRKGENAVSDNPMFLYAGEYENVDDAKADLEVLKELHREHVVGTYDAAVVDENRRRQGQDRRQQERSQPSTVDGLGWRSAQL